MNQWHQRDRPNPAASANHTKKAEKRFSPLSHLWEYLKGQA
jgi:hypothetical protein